VLSAQVLIFHDAQAVLDRPIKIVRAVADRRPAGAAG
jgi:hypothetical protein